MDHKFNIKINYSTIHGWIIDYMDGWIIDYMVNIMDQVHDPNKSDPNKSIWSLSRIFVHVRKKKNE
jgi:hypothetical protein